MKTAAHRLRELPAINRAIAETLDYDAVLSRVVDKACALTGGRASLLLLADPGAPATVVASVGVPPEVTRDFHAVLDERLGAALRDRLALGPEDAILAVPMIERGRVRGVLAAILPRETARAGDAARPMEEHEELLSALADQAARSRCSTRRRSTPCRPPSPPPID
jgi:GAF domain-containing protein